MATGVHAQVVYFSDDFNSYDEDGGIIPTSVTNWNSNARSYIELDDGTASVSSGSVPSDIFGGGTTNKFVNFNDNTTGSGSSGEAVFDSAVDGIATVFSFDFYETSSGGGDTMGFGYTNSDINNSGAIRVTLDDGEIGLYDLNTDALTTYASAYSMDTAYRIYMVANDSAASVSYESETIAAGAYGVFLQELSGSTISLVGTNLIDSSVSMSDFGFRTFSSALQQVFIDNVLVTGVIPEPAGFGLIGGLFGLASIALRRRRK